MAYIVTFIYNDSFRIEDAESPREALDKAKKLADYGWDDYEIEEEEEDD